MSGERGVHHRLHVGGPGHVGGMGQDLDAGRLAGPVGYGESRPLEQTAQTLPGCKSETNRRTELNTL